ncbi:MAG: hypothetical protein HYZ73_01430 [Elusimicrobia bacterium]|nr:hypothetical protein [Elusimicrobiota bacterium]
MPVAPAAVEMTVNDGLVLRETTLHQKGGSPWLTFPAYRSRRGIDYPEVTLSTYRAQRSLARQVLLPQSPPAPVSLSPRRGGRKAFATVTVNDELHVSARVMESRRRLWVAWPARQEGREWVRQVEFLDRSFQGIIERVLLAQYRELAEEAGL